MRAAGAAETFCQTVCDTLRARDRRVLYQGGAARKKEGSLFPPVALSGGFAFPRCAACLPPADLRLVGCRPGGEQGARAGAERQDVHLRLKRRAFAKIDLLLPYVPPRGHGVHGVDVIGRQAVLGRKIPVLYLSHFGML